jgi:TPR repeat protein
LPTNKVRPNIPDENGLGVPQDYTEATKWYRKAAEQGDAKAQYNLGYMYNDGCGVK